MNNQKELAKNVERCVAVLKAMDRMNFEEDIETIETCFYVALDFASKAKELMDEVGIDGRV